LNIAGRVFFFLSLENPSGVERVSSKTIVLTSFIFCAP
jgi:hypothetical protein